MARNFDVQKNNEHLYWAIGIFLLSVWCFRDGWFPSESTLEKYPNTPESFWSFGMAYEYYRFNRVTAVLTLIASAVLLVMHRVVNR